MGLQRRIEEASAKAANQAVDAGEIAEHEAEAFREGWEKGFMVGRLEKPDEPRQRPVYLPPDG